MAAWKLAPGAGGGKLLHPQARRGHAAHGDPAVRADRARPAFPTGAAQLLLGPGPTVGHALAAQPARGQGRLHRRHRDRAARSMKRAAGQPEEGHARARRQEPEHRLRRRGLRCGAGVRACSRIFAGQGEVCSAGSRLILERKTRRSASSPRLAEASNKIVVGDGLEPDDRDGAADHAAAHGARARLHRSRQERRRGARSAADRRLDRRRSCANGNFVAPTIFAKTQPEMRIVREEIFGPVLVRAALRQRRRSRAARQRHRSTASPAASSPATRAKACACCKSCAPASPG